MPDSELRVFLCSSHRDLATERLLAQEIFESLAREYEGFRYFAPRSQPAVETALAALADSDLAVCILGHCYGAAAPGLSLSHAEIEFREAEKTGLPVLVFLRREDYDLRPGKFEKDPARAAKVQEFRRRLCTGNCETFTDAPSLAVLMRTALEAEIAAQGLPKKMTTRAFPQTTLNASVKTVDPAPAEGAATKTLPVIQKALSTPFQPRAKWKESLWWWGAGCIAALLIISVILLRH